MASWYTEGTVAVTNGSTVVTGTGTKFSNARSGDLFAGPDNGIYQVINSSSDTAISISPAYRGATATGAAYGVVPVNGYPKALADAVNLMVQQWGSTLAGLGPLSSAAIAPVANGGTGASTIVGARAALQLKSGALVDVVGVVASGAILESGTNANGSYTKFADGTLICTNTILVTATIAPGASISPSITPAHAFVGSPLVSTALVFYTAGQGAQIYASKQFYGLSGSFINTGVSASASFPSFTALGNNTAYSYEFRFSAIGRWKA